jgi:flagellar biosynthesis chaperone FliJ
MISVAFDFSNNIKKIKEANSNFRKGSKQNFNFFSAIVSGKYSKEHHEKYHSNFIAYLLDPKATHDCESIFLKAFLEKIEEIKNKSEEIVAEKSDKKFTGFEEDEKQLLQISVEREKLVNGNIDIAIESKNKWLIFIENKIEHFEAPHQVKDYCDWAEDHYNEWLGVFLTKNGSSPPSIKDYVHKNKVICLSYREDIINWLKSCCTNEKLIYYPHIISALMQYINVIKKNLNIMDNKELEESQKYLKDNNSAAAQLAENISDLKQVLDEYIKIVRSNFLMDLKEKVVESLNNILRANKDLECSYENIAFKIKILQSYPDTDEGGRGLWWGIYPLEGSDFISLNSDLKLKKDFWEPVSFGDVKDDFYRDTDKGSALIIKSLDDINLKEKIITEITEKIVKKIAELINQRTK